MKQGKANVGFNGVQPPSVPDSESEKQTSVFLEGYCQSPSGFELPIKINIDGTLVKTLAATGDETEIEIALREIPYCDSDGTEYRILVFASQLFQVSE